MVGETVSGACLDMVGKTFSRWAIAVIFAAGVSFGGVAYASEENPFADKAKQDEKSFSVFVPISQWIQFSDGLASSSLVDSALLVPKRVSDWRSVSGIGVQGVAELDQDNVVDGGVSVQATHYLTEREFNLVNSMFQVGYTHRLDEGTSASVRADVNRGFAGADYAPYYWMGHVAGAFSYDYTPQMTVIYGADVTGYLFDGTNADDFDSMQLQFSAMPSYAFSSVPVRASLLMRATDSAARVDANGYRAVEALPQLTYTFNGRQVLELGAQYSRAFFDDRDTIQPGVLRKDETYGGSLGYTFPLGSIAGRGVAGSVGYSYVRNDSTLDRQDYASNTFTLGLVTVLY